MFKGLVTQRLLVLFLGGALLFNFPLLALWDRDVLLLGVPLFPAALFLMWGALIVLLALIVERGDDRGADHSEVRGTARSTTRETARDTPRLGPD